MKFKKILILIIVMGMIYINMEVIFRALVGELVKNGYNVKYLSLMGVTSIWMGLIGGLSGLTIGLMNEINFKGKNLPIWVQSVVGMTLVFIIEFISGYILNVKLGMNIWDYKNYPLNIMGQVTACYIPIWFLLNPLAMWIDDIIRYYLFNEKRPDPIITYFTDIIKGI